MGLFSTKKSTSQNTTNVLSLSDIDGNAVAGNNNIVTFSDAGAIQAAVDINETNTAFLGETFASALGYSDDVSARSLGYADDVSARSFSFGSDVYNRALDFVSDATRQSFEQANRATSGIQSAYNAATGSFDVAKLAMIGLGGIAVVYIASKVLK